MPCSHSDPLISVITPVYNAKSFLERCIQSVLNQTYEKLELILVDDGSTDGCGEICDAYAQRDGRIRVIHQPNAGVSAARNAGLRAATGGYIAWVDSDDYYGPAFLERMLSAIRTYNVPIAMCNYENQLISGRRSVRYSFAVEDRVYPRDVIIGMVLGYIVTPVLWANLVERALYDGIQFPEGKLFEDVATTYRIYEKADAVALVAEPLFFRVQRPDSISRIQNISNRVEGCLCYIARYEDIAPRWPQYRRAVLVASARQLILLRGNILRNSAKTYRAHAKDIARICAFFRGHTTDILPQEADLWFKLEFRLLTAGRRWSFFLSRLLDQLAGKPGFYLRELKTPDMPEY